MNSKFKKKAFFLVTFTLMLVLVTTVLLNWSVVEEKFLGKKSQEKLGYQQISQMIKMKIKSIIMMLIFITII